MFWPSYLPTESNESGEHHEPILLPHFLPRVMAAAAVEDVMWEQLAYLMDHGPCNPSNCPECSRFGQVRAILLRMFTHKK